MTGQFITIEGGEGAGKSTCIAVIEHALKQANIEFISTREPGGTELAEELRDTLLSHRDSGMHPHVELMLMFAARLDNLEQRIKPALEAGAWVVCDRFTCLLYTSPSPQDS